MVLSFNNMERGSDLDRRRNQRILKMKAGGKLKNLEDQTSLSRIFHVVHDESLQGDNLLQSSSILSPFRSSFVFFPSFLPCQIDRNNEPNWLHLPST